MKDFWGVETIQLYDPGVEEFSTRPSTSFDGDFHGCLGAYPRRRYRLGLAECFGFAKNSHMNIASYPAKKILPNGWNAHVTIRPPDWWRQRITKAARNWVGQAYVFDITEKRPRFGHPSFADWAAAA